jgi:hypothetical protein
MAYVYVLREEDGWLTSLNGTKSTRDRACDPNNYLGTKVYASYGAIVCRAGTTGTN